jgi:hypothetical protein
MVAAAQILHERVPGSDGAQRAGHFSPRIEPNLDLSRP